MKQIDLKSFVFFSFIIIFFATVLRFYKLGEVPHGMTWDEAAIGYNGFAIFQTRRDEWLNKLPVSFKSFGDYKSPFAIYLNAPFTHFFGMNLWAVRLPFAIAGVFSVVGMIWMTLLLSRLQFTENQARAISLSAGALLAFSPWHIHFTRIGFESGVALCFLIWGISFFILFFELEVSQMRKQKIVRIFWPLIGTLCLVLSFYTYHSAKIVTPLVLIALITLCWRQVRTKVGELIAVGSAGLIVLLPLFKDTFVGNGGNRFGQATIFGQNQSIASLFSEFMSHFFAHFSVTYLVLGETVTLRHGDGKWGVLLFTEYLLVIIGFLLLFVTLFKILQQKRKQNTSIQLLLFSVVWIVFGTLPAAIGTDVPHGNRGLLALPGFILLTVWGGFYLFNWLAKVRIDQNFSGTKGEDHLLVKSVIGMLFLFHGFFVLSYLHDYYSTFSKSSAHDFQDGFIEAFQFASENEATSDQILISDTYGQAYIFALFVRQTNPIWYQGGIMVKYVYLPKLSISDLERKNTVLIATPNQIPPDKADKLVYGSDGEIKFVLIKTK